MINRKPFHHTTLAAVLILACAGICIPGCSEQERGPRPRPPERALGVEGEHPPVDLVAAVELGSSSRAHLVASARRFALTFVRWLYGSRREVDVESIARGLAAELAYSAPHVPDEQIGSQDGRAVRVHVFLQTGRTGLMVLSIRDPRTTYQVPARFERRAGRWQVVHLNTH
jgi:hypothetical protein